MDEDEAVQMHMFGRRLEGGMSCNEHGSEGSER